MGIEKARHKITPADLSAGVDVFYSAITIASGKMFVALS